MNIVCILGWVLYLAALVCALAARHRPHLGWTACVLAVVAAMLMLYEGATHQQLAAGALVLALPLLLSSDQGGKTP